MLLLRRPAILALATVSSLFSSGVSAQPTLPRDGVPDVSRAIRPFVDRLYSPDARERAEAACQIGHRPLESAGAIPVLLAMLADDTPVAAIGCGMSPWLRKALAKGADARKWAETSPAREAAEALGDIGHASVPGLLDALGGADWKVRMFAAYGLGEVDDLLEPRRVAAALARTLTDANASVRDRSAWALGEIRDASAVEPLLDALRDGEPGVRTRAAWALGEIEDSSAVDGLVAALADPDSGVRERAVWALGEIESERAVGGLVPLLHDADAKVRRQAAWALGEIQHESAVVPLSGALTDVDWEVRKYAAWALGEIEDPSAIDAVRSVANDGNAEVRRAAAHALRELGDRTYRRK